MLTRFRLDLSSPVVLFRILMGLIAAFALAATIVVFYTTQVVTSASRESADTSDTALLASEAADRFRFLLDMLQGRVDEFMDSQQVTAAIEERTRLAGLGFGEPELSLGDSLADEEVRLSLADASEFQATIEYLRSRLSAILLRTDDPLLQAQSATAGQAVEGTLQRYFQEPTLGNLRELQGSIRVVLDTTSASVPGLAAESDSLRQKQYDSIGFLRTAMVGFAALTALTFSLFGRYLSSTIQGTIDQGARRQASLEETTRVLRYRNEQLNALYNVFSEITSTLSLHYVVQATLRESLRIMRADMAVLRILRGGKLEVEGALTAEGQAIEGLSDVELGEGPTGRTAKLGRTLRIDRDGERLMASNAQPGPAGSPSTQTQRPPLESGVIVPLVVGARVVGTLSCWALAEDAFTEGDERVLEMMASQVATAIVAADTTDTSRRHAHHDALTGLPNRRQLNADIDGGLAELARSGRNAVVAMLDVDHFKRFNDSYGHRVGDVTLQQVASVLRSAVREQDFVYRYGGEEFVVVFADTPPEEAEGMGNRMRHAVESLPLSGERLEPVGPVTVSIGLALVPEHGTDIPHLIELADRALYRAKQEGRNRVCVWDGHGTGMDLDSVA